MIDFTDPLFVADPYPALKELRNAPGPVWHEDMQMFLAAKHGDANDVFRNKSLGRIFKEKTPDFEWEIFNWLHADSILDSEPPKHTRLRSLVAKAFNRQKIEGMRPAVSRIPSNCWMQLILRLSLAKALISLQTMPNRYPSRSLLTC